MAEQLTRRHVLGAIGASVAGGGLLVAASREGRAQVSVDGLDVADRSFEREAVSPIAEATIAYEYAVAAPPTALNLELLVGETVVASTSLMTGNEQLSGEEQLSGRVLDSDQFAQSDFSVEPGESTTVQVPVTVRVAVLDGETVLADGSASESATVEVVHPRGSEYATIGGTVAFSAESDA